MLYLVIFYFTIYNTISYQLNTVISRSLKLSRAQNPRARRYITGPLPLRARYPRARCCYGSTTLDILLQHIALLEISVSGLGLPYLKIANTNRLSKYNCVPEVSDTFELFTKLLGMACDSSILRMQIRIYYRNTIVYRI
jgi:hypothetical protein